MKCTKVCENTWVLGQDGCSASFDVTVSLLSTLSQTQLAEARADEQQHVTDYQLGWRKIVNDVSEKEESLRRVSYPDEASCENAAIEAIKPILLRDQKDIAKESSDTYDYPGGPHHH
jgi:hypothetical protein